MPLPILKNRILNIRDARALEQVMLALLIGIVWLIISLMVIIIPEASPVIVVLLFMMIYIGYLTAAFAWHKRRVRKLGQLAEKVLHEGEAPPHVSIIIPAHNEAAVIERTVRQMLRLDYPHFDLMVVDDRSTDGTAQVLAWLKQQPEIGDRFDFYVRADEAMPGKSAVLNEAVTQVEGEIIAVFDADAFVEPDFLNRMVPLLQEDGVGAAQARKVILNARENLLTRCQHYEYCLDAHLQSFRDAAKGAVELRGNGQLVKRKAIHSIGGWNNHSLTDDLDLSTQLHISGWDIRFASKTLVYEEGITRFIPLLRQRRRWAEGSLRRYLQYGGQIFLSNKVALRTKFDMIGYFVDFIFPIWLVGDYLALAISYAIGEIDKRHVILSLIVLPVLTAFFIISFFVAIKRFNRITWLKAGGWSIVTGCYLSLIWIPVVFWVMVKVLLQHSQTLDWDKTAHTGSHTDDMAPTPGMILSGEPQTSQ
jgi:1,2-diacylglycerol 3-beta-glucosyltransferase